MTNKSKAAVFYGVEDIKITEIERPINNDYEVLVKLDYCALCTWERRVYEGVNEVEFPFIGGHEVSGEIVSIGNKVNEKLWNVGDKVVVGLMTSCGQCNNCKTGNEGSCESFSYENYIGGLNMRGMGGLSQYLSVTTDKLFKYDQEKISAKEAALVEPLSCVVHSLKLADVKIGDDVVVIGAGIMGALHAILCRAIGANVIISEPTESRIEFLRKLGFKNFIKKGEDFNEKVMNYTDGNGANIIFNTVAIPQIAEDSIDSLSLGGKLVLYSSYKPDKPISISPNSVHRKEYSIIGVANSDSSDFIVATKLIEDGIVDVKPFVNGVYKLENVEAAFKEALKNQSYRILVELN